MNWRELLLVLACFCFALQPGLLPLHLALHHHAPTVASHDHGTVHQHEGLAYFHCEPVATEYEHAHDHGHAHEHDHDDDPAPHPAEDHLTAPDLVGARPTLDLDLVAIPPSVQHVTPQDAPPSAFQPTAREAPRPPPPRGAHRARAPPSA